MLAFAVVLVILMVSTVALAGYEWRQWRHGRVAISRRRHVWRLVAAGLLLALLLAVYLGLFVLGLGDAQERPLLFMVFWMSCMALAIVLMFVAAADMRDVERLRDSHEAELWRDFARTLAARQRKEDRSNAKPPPQQR